MKWKQTSMTWLYKGTSQGLVKECPTFSAGPGLRTFLDGRPTNVKPRYCQANWSSPLLEEPRQSSAVQMSICVSTGIPAFLSLPCWSWRILLFIETGTQRHEARVEEKRTEVTGQRIEEHEGFWERSHRSQGDSEDHSIPEIKGGDNYKKGKLDWSIAAWRQAEWTQELRRDHWLLHVGIYLEHLTRWLTQSLRYGWWECNEW